MRIQPGLALVPALAGLSCVWGQEAARSELSPVRLETGAYLNSVSSGFGLWSGAYTQLWVRSSSRFIPAFTAETQSRPTGDQQNYSFFSYLNWTPTLYTTQGFSVAPQHNERAIYFPKFRYDADVHWKVPPARHVVLQAGYTQFDFGKPGHGQIFHAGAIYYRSKLVVESNLFLNRSQPGNLWSTSTALAAQYGKEGSYWLGATAGGGRELYRFVGSAPLDLNYKSYSVSLFYRRWITRRVGFLTSADYHDKLGAYRWIGVRTSLFFDF